MDGGMDVWRDGHLPEEEKDKESYHSEFTVITLFIFCVILHQILYAILCK